MKKVMILVMIATMTLLMLNSSCECRNSKTKNFYVGDNVIIEETKQNGIVIQTFIDGIYDVSFIDNFGNPQTKDFHVSQLENNNLYE